MKTSLTTKITKGSGNALASLLYIARARACDKRAGLEALDFIFVDEAGQRAECRGDSDARWAAACIGSTYPADAAQRRKPPAVSKMVVLSCPAAEGDTPELRARLMNAAFAWIARYGGGRPAAVACHHDKGHLHCHVVISNFDGQGVRLSFERDDLLDMCAADYAAQEGFGPALNAEEHRRATAGEKVDKAAALKTRDRDRSRHEREPRGDRERAEAARKELISMLAGGRTIETLIDEGVITVGRKGPDGEVKSIEYKGHRMRVASLHAGVQRLRDKAERQADRATARAGRGVAGAVRGLTWDLGRGMSLSNLDHLSR